MNKANYRLRIIKISWLNEQMYHILLKKEKIINISTQIIKLIVFIINIIASAVGEDVNYRFWTITTSIIIAFDVYINKVKDELAYGSKIESHRSLVDECIKFNDILDKSDNDNITDDIIEINYQLLIEKSSKLYIEPELYDNWNEEFKKRGIKEQNAFELTDKINKEISIIEDKKIDKRSEFEIQRMCNNL